MAHAFLKNEFGVKPKIGWQLDPFGHSAVTAELFGEFGLETMVFARINEQEFEQRKIKKDLQFIWKPKFSFS